MKIHIKVFGIILLIVISCKNDLPPRALFTIQTDQVQPDSKILLSSLLDTIRFIYLETNPNSLIGNIDKIVKKNGYIYISSDRKFLLKFNNKGHYINKIGEVGKGPAEFVELVDFDVNNDYIAILGYKKIYFYDFNGRIIKTLTLNFIAKKMKITNKGNFLFQTSGEKEVIFLTDSSGMKKGSFLADDITVRLTRKIPFIALNNNSIVFQVGYSNSFVNYNESDESFSLINLLSNENVLDIKHLKELQVRYGSEALNYIDDFICIDGISANYYNILFGYILNNHIILSVSDHSRGNNFNIIISQNTNIIDDVTYTSPSFLGLTLRVQSDSSFISYVFPYKIKEGMLAQIKTNSDFRTKMEDQELGTIIKNSSQQDNPYLIEFRFKNR